MSIDLPRSPAPRVSVIVPASSDSELLRSCLRSLERSGPNIPYETIIVMNTAEESAAAQLREQVTGVEVLVSQANLGLAGAGNRGRSVARGELLILLHDDAEIEPGWMEALVETIDARPDAGAVGGKVLYPDGRLQDAGLILWRDATTSPPWVGEAPAATAFDRGRAVDYCGTSSLLVRAAAWDAVGGLDERFYPVYFVDVDLAMALRQRGWVVLYQPGSRIRHHRGASGSLELRAFISERNRRRFLEKWSAALKEHEPPARNSAGAIEKAMARAEAFGEALRGRDAPATEAPLQARAFDAVEQERRHVEKGRELQAAYAAHVSEIASRSFTRRVWDALRAGVWSHG